jgi:hypothetical protein
MKFKKGDKVKIIHKFKDITSNEKYYQKETVVDGYDKNAGYYSLDIDKGLYDWEEHWLEPVEEIKHGDGILGGVSYAAQTQSFFDKAYASLARMQNEKNKRYGESALKPLDIFAKHHPYGSRIDEKLSRVKNSDVLRKNDLADIIGGIMLICKENGWDNFEDLID